MLALFALGNMVLCFLTASYLAVTRPVSGCCVWNTEIWILREILRFGRNAWLDSGCSASVGCAFGRIAHIFYGEVDSNSEVFCLRSHAELRSVLSRCFSSQSWYALLALGNLEITFCEAHMAGCICDDDGANQCAGTGSFKLVSVTRCSVVVLCGHTHCTPQPVSETTTTTSTTTVAILAQAILAQAVPLTVLPF